MLCPACDSWMPPNLAAESVDSNSGILMTRTHTIKLAILRLLFSIMLVFALAKAFVLPRKFLRLFHWDKAEHFTAFYLLMVLAAAAFPRRPLWAIALALSLLGAAIEVIQGMPFVARDSDFWDWFADTLAIVAVLLPLALPHWRSIAGRRSRFTG